MTKSVLFSEDLKRIERAITDSQLGSNEAADIVEKAAFMASRGIYPVPNTSDEDTTELLGMGHCKCRLIEIPETEVHALDKVNANVLVELDQVLTRHRSDLICYSGVDCRNCALSVIIGMKRYCFSEAIQNAAYRKKETP